MIYFRNGIELSNEKQAIKRSFKQLRRFPDKRVRVYLIGKDTSLEYEFIQRLWWILFLCLIYVFQQMLEMLLNECADKEVSVIVAIVQIIFHRHLSRHASVDKALRD